jgi:diamine N-acetyltransferase
MKIRQAKTSEWSILQKLNDEVFVDNASYDSDLIINWAVSNAGKKYFQKLVNDPNSICLVAENQKGNLVGYIAGSLKLVDYRKSKYFEIENMGVSPQHRSQGVGTGLMEQCLSQAKQRGYTKAYVNSYFDNRKAISFYKKNGFNEIDVSLEKTL